MTSVIANACGIEARRDHVALVLEDFGERSLDRLSRPTPLCLIGYSRLMRRLQRPRNR